MTPATPETTPILEARRIHKHFGRVIALPAASFDLRPNEVHAIVGDNGAGKSTFIKILSGVQQPDGGEILLDGAPVQIPSPGRARELGIETVYQDLALADHLDAAANLFLGRELYKPGLRRLGVLDRRGMRRRAEEEIAKFKIRVPSVSQPVLSLSGGQRQAIAVARAAAWGTRIVIMDEPTAALGVRESGMVRELIRDLRNHGVAVIVISHDFHEVFGVADRITVMRLGRSVATLNAAETDIDHVVRMVTGAVAA
jgi:simple sugar transport system ATP-binding protein